MNNINKLLLSPYHKNQLLGVEVARGAGKDLAYILAVVMSKGFIVTDRYELFNDYYKTFLGITIELNNYPFALHPFCEVCLNAKGMKAKRFKFHLQELPEWQFYEFNLFITDYLKRHLEWT